MMRRRQVTVLISLVILYALAAVVYIFMPGGALEMAAVLAPAMPVLAPWQMALGNAGLILLLYTPVGLAGLWLAHKAGLPGIFRPGATVWERYVSPLWAGMVAGLLLVLLDLLAQRIGDFTGFPHPPFPASLLASFTAAVGEEILFRLFVMSLWAALLGWLLRRLLPNRRTRGLTIWLANGLAAAAFIAGHLGTGMVLAGVATPADLPPLMVAELVGLNGIVGLLAGVVFARQGLVAAAGVHFWADIVWHGLYGALV